MLKKPIPGHKLFFKLLPRNNKLISTHHSQTEFVRYRIRCQIRLILRMKKRRVARIKNQFTQS